MAERKAVNKYYPPDWDPSKGTVNQLSGQHPLRDRARKLAEGILVVRFELPFPIWCQGCNRHIARGVRFNAEKQTVGQYHSTPILSFRMKCHLCDNRFVIQTDPQNAEYVVTKGARCKIETWDPKDAQVIELTGDDTKQRLASDSFARLEHHVTDRKKAHAAETELTQLQNANDYRSRFDYDVLRQVRKQFRVAKHKQAEQDRANQALLKRHSLALTLAPEHPDDHQTAKKAIALNSNKTLQNRKHQVAASPIFQPPQPNSSSSRPNASHSAASQLKATVLKTSLSPKLRGPSTHSASKRR
ncbi:Protein saf4 [Dimargaris verticillata]|uniref:Protein saf4 n=1 Tax=Dimargaris verticillata TaxID=2761393 RepID=A0A9W8EFE7_9FUNG|nr:Protein saf4 [Dimargaris verticillata]